MAKWAQSKRVQAIIALVVALSSTGVVFAQITMDT
jgi:hypothetical protein